MKDCCWACLKASTGLSKSKGAAAGVRAKFRFDCRWLRSVKYDLISFLSYWSGESLEMKPDFA